MRAVRPTTLRKLCGVWESDKKPETQSKAEIALCFLLLVFFSVHLGVSVSLCLGVSVLRGLDVVVRSVFACYFRLCSTKAKPPPIFISGGMRNKSLTITYFHTGCSTIIGA